MFHLMCFITSQSVHIDTEVWITRYTVNAFNTLGFLSLVSYKSTFGHLKTLKMEIEHLQLLLERSKVKLQRDFQDWWSQEAAMLQVTLLPLFVRRRGMPLHKAVVSVMLVIAFQDSLWQFLTLLGVMCVCVSSCLCLCVRVCVITPIEYADVYL
jgi:hypothetical protein